MAAEVKKTTVNAIDQAGKLALDSYRSSVPIDTQELRNQIITQSRPSISASAPQTTVFIAQVTHYGRDKKPIDAGLLVDILNNNRKKRSQPSNAVSGFPSYSGFTKDWIDKAENNFLKKIDRFLASKDFSI